MTIISKKKNWNPWRNCQKYALKLFWNVYIWHVLEDPIFYGQWTNLHDRSQNGPNLVTNDYLVWSLTSNTHQNTNSIAMWETLHNNADWDCFKTSILRGNLEDSKSTSCGTLCVCGSHTFVPISWMCKKQTSVSHSSTESEIISLDAGLRMDGKPALDLWDLIVTVLGNTNQSKLVRWNLSTSLTRKKFHGQIDDLNNVDFVSSNVNSSRKKVLLYIFEYNEAVIKMIKKGRSPTMRHVARTQQSCSWLVIRSNHFGPQNPNQIHWHQKPTRRHTDQGKFKISKNIVTITKTCSNPGFLLELWKNYQKPEFQGNLMRTLFLHGLMIWKVMQRSA